MAERHQQKLNDEGCWEGRSEPLDPKLAWTDEGSAEWWREERRAEVRSILEAAEVPVGPQPGVMHPIDQAFYRLVVKERLPTQDERSWHVLIVLDQTRGRHGLDGELLGGELTVTDEHDRRLRIEVFDVTEEVAASEGFNSMAPEVFVFSHQDGSRTRVHAQSYVDFLLGLLGRHRSDRAREQGVKAGREAGEPS